MSAENASGLVVYSMGIELDLIPHCIPDTDSPLEDSHNPESAPNILDHAIKNYEKFFKSLPIDDPNRPQICYEYLMRLGERYQISDSMEHLREAISQYEKALPIIPLDFKHRYLLYYTHALLLSYRINAINAPGDHDAAVSAATEAVRCMPAECLVGGAMFNKLASCLGQRYMANGNMADLNSAIKNSEQAITFTNSPNLPIFANNLGLNLGYKYNRTGDISLLQSGIQRIEEAIKLVGPDSVTDPNLSLFQNNLGLLLQDRYVRTGAVNDLEEAISALESSVSTTPSNDTVGLAIRSNNLSTCLSKKFSRNQDLSLLEKAILTEKTAINNLRKEHPDHQLYLNNLGNLFGDKYTTTKQQLDLDESIRCYQDAIRFTNLYQPEHPNLPKFLNNLAGGLKDRFTLKRESADLDGAISNLHEAVAKTPENHSDRAERLCNLGLLLFERSANPINSINLEQAVSILQEALKCQNTSPITRIKSGKVLHACFVLLSQWEDAYQALDATIRLIPNLAPKSLIHTDKQHVLKQVVGLASTATAAALTAGKDAYTALALLEIGRSVIATSLQDMRADVQDLKNQHIDLAERFIQLRDKLDTPAWRREDASARSWQDEASRRYDAQTEFDSLLEEIRRHPGFEDFLASPTEELMKQAAHLGPIVVINVSDLTCDAIIIQQHGISSLALPKLNRAAIRDKSKGISRNIKSILEWLWDSSVYPVLDFLGMTQVPIDGILPRIWWIPTGALSKFPLHAAGRYGRNQCNNALSLVRSSYSTSIRAIIYGRRQVLHKDAPPASGKVMLVNMEKTPAHPNLPYASKEVSELRSLFDLMKIKIEETPPFKKNVLEGLPLSTIFHFAGHGHTHQSDPSQSYLLLQDWKTDKLAIADLLEINIRERSPFLAYLSACETGSIKDNALDDEGLHLIGAFQLAGFRHMIGTFWEVSDRSCFEMSKVTYEAIVKEDMTDESVCEGLHRAAMALCNNPLGIKRSSRSKPVVPRNLFICDEDDEENEEQGYTNFTWVPYAHYGV